jgi:predicted DNA-binding protein
MGIDAFVQCRVSSEVKDRLRQIASQRQTTESALVRQLLESVLKLTDLEEVGHPERALRDERLCVRLATEDRLLLADRARTRGLPASTYVSVVVRSHLRGMGLGY